MEEEIWKKAIPGYEVSSLGRIKSCDRMVPFYGAIWRRQKERIMAQFISNVGYPSIKLYGGKYVQNSMVHTLVAYAFMGPRPEGLVINHKDGNKQNNRFQNLEYVTQSENLRKGKGCRGEDHGLSKLTILKVKKLRMEYIPRKITYLALAKKYGVSEMTVYRAVHGQCWAWLA